MSENPTHADDTGPRVQFSPQIGDLIGPYRVKGELGRGGMGIVLSVVHEASGAPFALKLLVNEAGRADLVARFVREAQVLAKVRHPDVVRVFELGRAPAGPYLVTELIEGEPLDRVVRLGPLAPAEACRLVIRLCGAVSAVHAAGILHRDLKPQNVIMRPSGTPVLLDFGIAQDESAEQLTQTGQLLGTPSYMSPEQAAGDRRAVDARSDVYGLGAILFTLLNGARPFLETEERGQFALIRAVLGGDPTWPRAKRLPPGLVAVGRRALAKERLARPQSPDAFAAELEAHLADLARSRGRRPLTLGLLGLAVLAAGGVVAAGALRADSKPPASASPLAAAPPDLAAKLAALGGFDDPEFEARLERLERRASYRDHLQPLRDTHQAWARLERASQSALGSGQGTRPELLAELRTYLRAQPTRPESPALRARLALLVLQSPPERSLTLTTQRARVYGGLSLDPAGGRVLAVGYRDEPVFGWATDAAGQLQATHAPAAVDPLVVVDLLQGSERPLPGPTLALSALLRSEVGAWLGCQQPAPVENPRDPGASLRLLSARDLSLAAELYLLAVPGQSESDLARGTGQPRVLAYQDGRLAIGVGDGTVAVYDTATRKRVWQQLEHHQRIVGLGFLPDGRLLSASGRSLRDPNGDLRAHPPGEIEDMRLVLWSPEGQRVRSYQRVLSANGTPLEPSLVLVRGKRALVGTFDSHQLVDLDLERPDDAPGEVHRLVVGRALEAPGAWRQGSGLASEAGRLWDPDGYPATGALWLGDERLLVWGASGRGWTVLRLFEPGPKGSYEQVAAWLRRDQVTDVWLSPDGEHLLISARLAPAGEGGDPPHTLEWRRIAP